MASIQGIYIALFGRPADPAGLAYFNSITNNGQNLSQIDSLAGEREYLDRFQGQNNAQIVTQIYQDLYGRDPDAAGLAYFVAELNSGRQNINTIAINIYDGARGADLEVRANKEAAANLFTQNVDTQVEIASYQGANAAAAGRAYLSAVTADDATVPTAAQAQAAVQGVVDASNAGNVFTVLPTQDVVVGEVGSTVDSSNRADTVTVSGNYVGTNNINTGLGSDTVNVGVAAPVATTATSLVGVERLNVVSNGATGTINLAETTGLEQVWAVGSATALTISGLELGTTVGLSAGGVAGAGATTFVFADATGGSDAATLAIDEAGARGAVTIANIEDLSISVDGDASFSLVAADAETITVTGTGDLVLTSALAVGVETFDASGLDGNVTVTTGLTTDSLDVITGGGTDTVTVAAGAQGVTVTLGGGNDQINIDAISNVTATTQAAVAADLITVTDFSAAADTLSIDLTGAATTFTNAQEGQIEGASDLAAALGIVGGLTATGAYAIFDYQGDTYVYQNDADTGFDAGDGIVKLVGFSADDFDAGSNLVVR